MDHLPRHYDLLEVDLEVVQEALHVAEDAFVVENAHGTQLGVLVEHHSVAIVGHAQQTGVVATQRQQVGQVGRIRLPRRGHLGVDRLLGVTRAEPRTSLASRYLGNCAMVLTRTVISPTKRSTISSSSE